MKNSFKNKSNVVSTPVEFFKKVSIYIKGLLEKVSNKAELLLGEIKEVSEGTPEIDYSKSIFEIFKLTLKYKIISLLNKDIIINKLIDFTDKIYLLYFCRDSIVIFIYKKELNKLFSNAMSLHDYSVEFFKYNIPPNIIICIFGLILALFCAFSTGVLYHSYRELPNNVVFNNKAILGSMKVSFGFWIITSLLLLNVISINFLISFILGYLFVCLIIVIISAIIATIQNKMVYLLG